MKLPRFALLRAAAGALAVVACAEPRLAWAGGTAEATRKEASIAPLFDTHARLKKHQTVKLAFRAEYKPRNAPIRARDLTVWLRPPVGAVVTLAPREVKRGVIEVPVTPEGPGLYLLGFDVKGLPAGSIRAVRLSVVGAVDGLIEVPEDEDAQFAKRKKIGGKGPR